MGKVGSVTIYNTIKNLKLTNSVFHVHFLSSGGINRSIKNHLRIINSVIPMHLRRSKLLRKNIIIGETNLKIITLVRDPISRIISDAIQNIRIFTPQFIISRKSLDYDKLLKHIELQIENYDISKGYAETWFDLEFKQALNIDVFNTKFDIDKGFQIIKENNIECLILKLENLNSTGSEALQLFLATNFKIDIQPGNIGSEKNYSFYLKQLKNDISIDEKTLQYIYSSKYMKHFYSENEINYFIKKWS